MNKKKNGSEIQDEWEQKMREENQNDAISKEDQMEGKIDQEREKSNPLHSAKQSKSTEREEINVFESAS